MFQGRPPASARAPAPRALRVPRARRSRRRSSPRADHRWRRRRRCRLQSRAHRSRTTNRERTETMTALHTTSPRHPTPSRRPSAARLELKFQRPSPLLAPHDRLPPSPRALTPRSACARTPRPPSLGARGASTSRPSATSNDERTPSGIRHSVVQEIDMIRGSSSRRQSGHSSAAQLLTSAQGSHEHPETSHGAPQATQHDVSPWSRQASRPVSQSASCWPDGL